MADMKNQKPSKTSTQTTGLNAHSTSTSTKRKRNRRRSKGKSKAGAVAQANRLPVKEYISKCCGASAKKPRTGTSMEKAAGAGSHPKQTDPTNVRGLGGWRCSTCGKPTKVTPQVPKPKEEVSVVG